MLNVGMHANRLYLTVKQKGCVRHGDRKLRI